MIAEFSLITVDRALIKEQAKLGIKTAVSVDNSLKNLSFQLSGAQLGVTITALLSGYIAEPAITVALNPLFNLIRLESYREGIAAGSALTLATFISIVFGELVPKNAALAKPHELAKFTSAPLRGWSTAGKPLISSLNGCANWLITKIGINPHSELASARTPDELALLATLSAKAGTLPKETAAIVRRIIRFGDKKTDEAMTPRVDVIALTNKSTVADLLALAQQSGHTRFPIYRSDMDNIVGIANVIDALTVASPLRDTTLVSTISSEPVFIPSSIDLDRVLAILQDSGAQLGIVVDEYGGTDGIVSVEDLIEELVGDIDDEHDPINARHNRGQTASSSDNSAPAHPSAQEAILASGLWRYDELHEHTGFTLPEGPFETLAGFILSTMGKIPQVGDSITYKGWSFTIHSVDKHRIGEITLLRPVTNEESSASAKLSDTGQS